MFPRMIDPSVPPKQETLVIYPSSGSYMSGLICGPGFTVIEPASTIGAPQVPFNVT